jgi:hypothetical protein
LRKVARKRRKTVCASCPAPFGAAGLAAGRWERSAAAHLILAAMIAFPKQFSSLLLGQYFGEYCKLSRV